MDEISYIKQRGIGLSGGAATGKSTISKIIREQGFRVFDADVLARQAVAPGSDTLSALVAKCGDSILSADGSLARKKLGAMIFADARLRKDVETLIHARIWQLLGEEVRDYHAEAGDQAYWFFDAALLFETGNYQRFAQIWLTTCPESVQRQRLIARDHLSPAYADQVLASQFPLEHKKHLAQVIIDTAQPIALGKKLVLAHLKTLR